MCTPAARWKEDYTESPAGLSSEGQSGKRAEEVVLSQSLQVMQPNLPFYGLGHQAQRRAANFSDPSAPWGARGDSINQREEKQGCPGCGVSSPARSHPLVPREGIVLGRRFPPGC